MKHGTILAVDDDGVVLETYRALLDNAYRVHLAASAEEALDFLVRRPRIDVILLDI